MPPTISDYPPSYPWWVWCLVAPLGACLALAILVGLACLCLLSLPAAALAALWWAWRALWRAGRAKAGRRSAGAGKTPCEGQERPQEGK